MTHTRLATLLLFGLLMSACGGSGGGPGCDHGEADRTPAISGRIYTDHDLSDTSLYDSGYKRGDVYRADTQIDLLGGAAERTFSSCDDGFFAFGDLADGLYLVAPGLSPDAVVTTRNRPRRLPQAVREGSIAMVAFGDSLPVVHETVRFPELAAERLSALAEVNLANVAEGGTTSEDWLPGNHLFDEVLLPVLPDADLIVISLGGNDILYFAEETMETGDFEDILDNFDAELDGILARLLVILHAIREHNPDADVVYLLYPNYAVTDAWAEWLGALQDFVIDLLDGGIRRMRSELDPHEHLLMIDLFGAVPESGRDLNDLLIDELHFNDAGHDFIADELLKTLGAARVGAHPLGLAPVYGIAP